LLDFHQGLGEVPRQAFRILERAARGVDIDHRHFAFSYRTATVAADSISFTTSAGWETIARWPAGTSTVFAPIRLANMRSTSGGIASSLVATRYQLGSDFHAGTRITSSNVLMDSPCCTADMTLARLFSTPEAKWATKSSSGIQAKACSSTIRWASEGVGGPAPSHVPSDAPRART